MKINITLMGKAILPIYYPIKSYDVDIIYILGTGANKQYFPQIKRVLENEEGRKCYFCKVDPYDFTSTVKICEEIHARANNDDTILYNVTGGTKLMALSAMTVGLKYNAEIIYTTPDNKKINIDNYSKTSLDCTLDNKKIFSLLGQELDTYDLLNSVDEKKIRCSRAVLEFKENHPKEYKEIQNFYQQNKNQIRGSFSTKNCSLYEDEGSIIVEKEGKQLLSLIHPDSFELLLEGRWWETLVSSAIFKWSKGRYEIWQNVVFKPKEKRISSQTGEILDIAKNEVDILINIGNTLLFVECKSGIIDQNNVYKMEFVRETYGEDKSKSILVSYYPIKSDILEKLDNTRASYFAPPKNSRALVRKNNLSNLASELDKIILKLNL